MAAPMNVNRPIFLQFLLACMIAFLIYIPHGQWRNHSTITAIMFRNTQPRNFTFANNMNIGGKTTQSLDVKKHNPV